jgi:hypothetical protein
MEFYLFVGVFLFGSLILPETLIALSKARIQFPIFLRFLFGVSLTCISIYLIEKGILWKSFIEKDYTLVYLDIK